jgi:uncharacterized cupin superfamily protein
VRWHPLRHALGVRSFGVNAYSGAAGQDVIEEHTESDEDGRGHQELYVVLSGTARFEIDGEPVDAPAGTQARRRARMGRGRFRPRRAARPARLPAVTVAVIGGDAWVLGSGPRS